MKKTKRTIKKIVGATVGIALVGAVAYGGYQVHKNWDNITNGAKDFIQDCTTSAELENVKKELAETKTKLETEQANVISLTEQKTTLETEISQLETELAEATEDNTEKQTLLEQKTAELEQTNTQLAESEARVAELEEELALKENITVTTGDNFYVINVCAKMSSGAVGYDFTNSSYFGFRMLGSDIKDYLTQLKNGNSYIEFIREVAPTFINYTTEDTVYEQRIDETKNEYSLSTCRDVIYNLKDADSNEFDIDSMDDNTDYEIKLANIVLGELSGDVLTNGSFDIVVTPVV